jgi:hypothetical protein
LSACRLSPPLWRLLSSNLPADGEVEAICSDPLLHREVKHAAPYLKALAQGVGDEGVGRALQPLVVVFGVGDAATTKAFWRVYYEALRDIPAEALGAAVRDYTLQADAQWFPKPGPLRALALKHAEPLYKAAYRAKRAADSLPRKPIQRISGEQVRELAVLLGGKPKGIPA